MKKKIIIISIFVFIGLLITALLLYINRTVYIINLDINPSIEIKMKSNNKVKKVKALNSDANIVINDNFKGKSLDETIKKITDNLIKNDYIKDSQATILLYTTGDIDKVKNSIEKIYHDKGIAFDIIVIDKITKEDEELAKKYNISLSKAAYINKISKDNKKIEKNALIDKPVNELKETKETGKYCEKGYNLEGDFCLKEIDRKEALKGMVCPSNYIEHNGTCYYEEGSIILDEYECPDDRELVNNKCIIREEIEAKPNFTCSSGEAVQRSRASNRDVRDNGDPNEYLCEDKSNAVAPTLRCLTINHTMIGGECYVGPAPLIDGGCPNGDTPLGDGCYSKDDGDQWVCPNGDIYEKSKDTYPELCPDTFTYSAAEGSYSCDKGTLRGSICVIEREEEPRRKAMCKEGSERLENGRCVNLNDTKEKINGYYCDIENSKVDGSTCIIYDIVEALNKGE